MCPYYRGGHVLPTFLSRTRPTPRCLLATRIIRITKPDGLSARARAMYDCPQNKGYQSKLTKCWASVASVGPTLTQHRFSSASLVYWAAVYVVIYYSVIVVEIRTCQLLLGFNSTHQSYIFLCIFLNFKDLYI